MFELMWHRLRMPTSASGLTWLANALDAANADPCCSRSFATLAIPEFNMLATLSTALKQRQWMETPEEMSGEM